MAIKVRFEACAVEIDRHFEGAFQSTNTFGHEDTFQLDPSGPAENLLSFGHGRNRVRPTGIELETRDRSPIGYMPLSSALPTRDLGGFPRRQYSRPSDEAAVTRSSARSRRSGEGQLASWRGR